MPEVRGKFITLAGTLMTSHPEQSDQADSILFERTGKHWRELNPDDWYDAEVYKLFLEAYCKGSSNPGNALIELGRRIFPLKKLLDDLPEEFPGAMDLILFSTKSFAEDHRGAGIRPVKIIKAEEGDMELDVPDHGYDCKVDEGVYMGILEMYGIKSGKVEQTRCKKEGNPSCIFHITW